MKRLIAFLIAILALIAGAGRTEERSVSDCSPVSAEITEEEVSPRDVPTETDVTPVLLLENDLTIDAHPCETKQETADRAPRTEPIKKEATEPTEVPAEEIPDIFSAAVDPAVEPLAGTEYGDSGDRVTAETDIEKNDETTVTETNEAANTVAEPEPMVEPVFDTESPFDETEAEQHGGNAPVFVNPARGGPNPFENAPPTEIEDHPVDEFIGEGDDRPGEGIHF